jgi:hypothetical protein
MQLHGLQFEDFGTNAAQAVALLLILLALVVFFTLRLVLLDQLYNNTSQGARQDQPGWIDLVTE